MVREYARVTLYVYLNWCIDGIDRHRGWKSEPRRRLNAYGFESHIHHNMTKEERKQWYHDWYWNRGGREQTLQRRRERGPQKWGGSK